MDFFVSELLNAVCCLRWSLLFKMFNTIWYTSGHSPRPYSICINDLPESILHSSIKLFDDDCIIYKAIHTPEDTEEDLNALQEWQERWLMRLIVSKCFSMNVYVLEEIK